MEEHLIKAPIRSHEDFFAAVKFMREHQKKYFRTRDRFELNRSMSLEKMVDEYIEFLRPKEPDTQMTIFDMYG